MRGWVKKWITEQIDEIQGDPILQWTGLLLCLAHLITAHFWWSNESYLLLTTGNSWTSCFPFFSNCQILQFGPGIAQAFFLGYLILSMVGLFLFWRPSTLRLAYFLLLALSLIKLALFASRYNFMGNYHTMHFIMLAVFLFIPQKRSTWPLVICLLYFMASLLKFNFEWLSGAALLQRPSFQGDWLVLSLAYVVVLEAVLVWGLLSRSLWLRALTLLQLAVFHLYSYEIVGYFYPAIMFCLLTPLVLSLFSDRQFSLSQVSKAGWVFCILLLGYNLWPKWLDADPALDGHLRYLALNMLDARSECRALALVTSGQEQTFVRLPRASRALRIHCDPVVYESLLREYCEATEEGSVLSFVLYAKRATDENYSTVRDLKDVCSAHAI